MKTIKAQLIETLVKLGFDEARVVIEYPVDASHGDFSTNVAMVFAKDKEQSPLELAEQTVAELKKDSGINDIFSEIQVVKPGFINFFLSDSVIRNILSDISSHQDRYGTADFGEGKKVMVEYSSPNSNKPLHLGHLRNHFIGMSLANVLSSVGYDVIKTEIINDRGMGISKSMLGYKLWGNDETPDQAGMKSDHFVGKYYVEYSTHEKDQPELVDQVHELLQKWEAGDKETRVLWQQMRDWAEKGYAVTYKNIDSEFDMHEYESDIYDKGKDIVLDALKNNLAQEIEGGAIAVDLTKYNLGGRENDRKILIKSDGTAVYMTQDLYLALQRWQTYKPEKVLYVVGDEQKYHFNVLFKILETFGYDWVTDRYTHVAYGMVNLPEGKMKSREGTVVDADDLLEEVSSMAQQEILAREPELEHAILESRAREIALAALKFFILKVDAASTMTYDPKASLDFEGNTGPYIQYTYARLGSIMQKAEQKAPTPPEDYALTDLERRLLVLLSRYPETVMYVATDFKPHRLAEYLFNVASVTNSWYAQSPVLGADEKTTAWRLNLVSAVQIVLRNGLKLLNIPVIEKM